MPASPRSSKGTRVLERLGLADPALRLCWAWADARQREVIVAALCDRLTSVEVVAHRPGRRIVLRLEGQRSGRSVCFYLKGMRQASWNRTARAVEGARAAALHDIVALPCATFEALHACAFEAIDGACLHRIGRAGGIARIGFVTTLLARFAAADGAAAQVLAPRTFEDERRSTLAMLERGCAHVGQLDRLHEQVRAWELPVSAPSDGFVHGDLHDKQIFAPAARVIDLDGAGWGSPWIDRANLLEHVHLRVLQGVWTRAWSASLVDVLALSPAPPAFVTARRLARARLAGVYAQRPAWLDLARTLANSVHDIDRGTS